MKKILLLTVIMLGLYSCEYPKNSRPVDAGTIELSIGAHGCDTVMILQPQEDEWYLEEDNITIITMEEGYKRIYFPVCDAVLSNETGLSKPVRPDVCSDSIMTVKYDILSEKRVEIV
jgi:hypothetical protein